MSTGKMRTKQRKQTSEKKRQQNNERRRNRKKPHVRLYKYKCVMSGLKVTSPGQMSCRYLIRMDILEKKDSPLFPFSPNFVLFAPISLTPPQRGLCLVAYTGSSQGIIYTWTGGDKRGQRREDPAGTNDLSSREPFNMQTRDTEKRERDRVRIPAASLTARRS